MHTCSLSCVYVCTCVCLCVQVCGCVNGPLESRRRHQISLEVESQARGFRHTVYHGIVTRVLLSVSGSSIGGCLFISWWAGKQKAGPELEMTVTSNVPFPIAYVD